MPIRSIVHCEKSLDFAPQARWPEALPAYAWQNLLLTAFTRKEGDALELECSFLEAWVACYPTLTLSEMARAFAKLKNHPELWPESGAAWLKHYGLRPSARLEDTLAVLAQTPRAFQDFVDEKKWGVRDLAPLLSLPHLSDVKSLLEAILGLSKSEAVQALEATVELFLMGHSVEQLLLALSRPGELERLRKPRAFASDQSWRTKVATWPWPAQVKGEWLRRGDETGLEIRLHARSPEDLAKKLERLRSIQEAWSCTTT